MICLGSIKSNPVAELILAEAFGCEPFQSADELEHAHERACPIFLRYRADDPHPPSCSGGLRLSRHQDSPSPGLYYETQNQSGSIAAGTNRSTTRHWYSTSTVNRKGDWKWCWADFREGPRDCWPRR